jgi:2-iminobutanoate/2-iminopropanoate deaminase
VVITTKTWKKTIPEFITITIRSLSIMKTVHPAIDTGIASQIGHYSDAIAVNNNVQWLFSSATPGLPSEGELNRNISEQAELAWEQLLIIVNEAGMGMQHLVKITQYLTFKEDIPDYVKVRHKVLGECKPASTLLVIEQLDWPDMLISIEFIAAKPIDKSGTPGI